MIRSTFRKLLSFVIPSDGLLAINQVSDSQTPRLTGRFRLLGEIHRIEVNVFFPELIEVQVKLGALSATIRMPKEQAVYWRVGGTVRATLEAV